ncbi:MAG: metallophosphoesterase [Eubacterium sp.]
MMLRFVHIADVHLGVSPDAQMPWGEKRKEDIRKSFYKVLHIVREEKIPLLLIAGDLFHGTAAETGTERAGCLFFPDAKDADCLRGGKS